MTTVVSVSSVWGGGVVIVVWGVLNSTHIGQCSTPKYVYGEREKRLCIVVWGVLYSV